MKRFTQLFVLAMLLISFTATASRGEINVAPSLADTVCTTGDIDLDGISSSIADAALFASYFRCGLGVFLFAPEPQITGTDFNCDGVVLSVGDLVALIRELSGELAPCYCTSMSWSSDSAITPTAIDPYTISLVDSPGAGHGRDTVDIMISGVNELLGYQLHIEYDTTGLSLVEVLPTDLFADWQVFAYTDTIIGSTARLKIVATSNFDMPSTPNLLPPAEPTAMARLVFDLPPDAELTREIKFVWDNCYDNGIAVNDTNSGICGAPEFLALSREVFDPAGTSITGSSPNYGGSPDSCLLASTGGNPPQRAIDFHNGQLVYTPSCCVGNRGDVDGDGEDAVISDLTCLVAFLFGDGCATPCLEEVDINGNGSIDISDLTDLVSYMFSGGPPPAPCF
ncbi:MAG: hypothetical protein P1R58_03075 [bacterium]|nr:hypothetical protein [bacterium]